MPVQATLTQPNPLFLGPFIRIGARVLKARGAGQSWGFLSQVLLPFSITKKWPLVIAIPVDVYKYYTFRTNNPFGNLDEASRLVIERIFQAQQWLNQYGIFYNVVLDPDQLGTFSELLGRFAEDTAIQAADGSIVVTMPEVWFRDP